MGLPCGALEMWRSDGVGRMPERIPSPDEQSLHKLTCRYCTAPYGEDGWCDVVIPNEIWNSVFPEDGVVCFRCMTKRIEEAGLRDVPVIVASGPYADNNERWRMI